MFLEEIIKVTFHKGNVSYVVLKDGNPYLTPSVYHATPLDSGETFKLQEILSVQLGNKYKIEIVSLYDNEFLS